MINLDCDKDSKIHYNEFLAASINVSEHLTKKKLDSLFLQFDNDGSGQISEANIKIAMSKFGMTVSAEEIKVIMAEHDEDKDGGISKEEFAKIFGLNPSL